MGRKAKNKMSLAEFYATVGDGAAPAQDLPTAPASEEERQRQREEKERRYQSFNRDREPDFSRGSAGANAGEPKPSDADRWESGQVVQAPARESQGFGRYSNFGDDSRRGWGRDPANSNANANANANAPERPAEPVNWRDNPNPVDRPAEGFGGFGARRGKDGPTQQGDSSQPPQRPVRTTEADNANDWRSMPRVVPTPEEAPRSRFEGGFRNREEDGRPRREDGDRERPRFGNFGRGPSATEGRQSTESKPVADEGSWRRAADTEERPKVDQGSWRGSSAPQREQQNRDAPQRKPRSNPFGDARPRDEPAFERKPLPLDNGNAQ